MLRGTNTIVRSSSFIPIFAYLLQGLEQHSSDMNIQEMVGDQFPTTRWVMPRAHDKRVTVFGHDKAMYESARELNAVISHERDELIRGLRTRGGLSSEESSSLGARGRRSAAQMRKIVPGEFGTLAEKEWANQRILLGVFSQGGAMALLSSLTNKYQLGGVFVLSGFLRMREKLPQYAADRHQKNIPVFWGHGENDSYVPCVVEDATASVALLRSSKPNRVEEGGVGLHHLQFMTYPNFDHAWFDGELIDLAVWMSNLLENLQMPFIFS
ncbi:BQ2448_1031 [Microbotryum intermedium]|uniref:Acyl-protein thioesterase 1 n=1 Tax=Microbotryum intermedium TaxID=269621 RepID=A0A238F4K7_9BASI|nr:BQ2448_1031 [Microbotryum intermedium]